MGSRDPGATLDDLREAVTTLEDTERTRGLARRGRRAASDHGGDEDAACAEGASRAPRPRNAVDAVKWVMVAKRRVRPKPTTYPPNQSLKIVSAPGFRRSGSRSNSGRGVQLHQILPPLRIARGKKSGKKRWIAPKTKTWPTGDRGISRMIMKGTVVSRSFTVLLSTRTSRARASRQQTPYQPSDAENPTSLKSSRLPST